MVYRDLTPRSLCAAAIGLALACNPDKGDDTSASDSAVTTGNESTGGATTGPTTDVDPTTGVTTTGSSETATSTTGMTATNTATGTTTTTTDATTGDDTTGGALGCGEDPEFTASWNAWQDAVGANGATYHYSLIRGISGFAPDEYCLYRTLVAVADGVVVERRFEISGMVGNPVDCEMPFIEKGEDIGTHDSEFAAVPATVEALYGACCEDVIHVEPAEEYTVNFVTDDQGFMKECFYVANGCADSCAGGPFGPVLSFEQLAFGDPPAP